MFLSNKSHANEQKLHSAAALLPTPGWELKDRLLLRRLQKGRALSPGRGLGGKGERSKENSPEFAVH